MDHYGQKINRILTQSLHKHSTNEFFKNYYTIFSLNYDPISYHAFKDFFRPENNPQFVDGFQGETAVNAEVIFNNLQKNKMAHRFYFPHGAFHIFAKKIEDAEDYYKETTSPYRDNNYLKKIRDAIKEKHKHITENPNEPFKKPVPLIIFEDRPEIKKSVILKDDYLRKCYEELQKATAHIFVYGCSFERDHHILEAIFKDNIPSKDNTCVYISHLSSDKEIKKKITDFLSAEKIQSSCKNITWVKINEEDEKERHWIWQRKLESPCSEHYK